MIFGTGAMKKKFKDLVISQHNIQLNITPKAKYLGVILDSQLKFAAHTQYIKSKTICKLKLLGRVRGSINRSTAELLDKSLILPMFEYADVIFHCLNQRDATTLQRLQNMGIDSVLQANRLTSTSLIHEEIDIPLLAVRREINCATEMYKVDKGLAPPNVSNMFVKCADSEGAITRQPTRGDYRILHCRLEFGRCNF